MFSVSGSKEDPVPSHLRYMLDSLHQKGLKVLHLPKQRVKKRGKNRNTSMERDWRSGATSPFGKGQANLYNYAPKLSERTGLLAAFFPLLWRYWKEIIKTWAYTGVYTNDLPAFSLSAASIQVQCREYFSHFCSWICWESSIVHF